MSGPFVDTSYFVALRNVTDQFHSAAIELNDLVAGGAVTTEYVLVETANFFTRVGRREVFVNLVRDLRRLSKFRIIPSSTDLFDRGLSLFESRPEKEWSLTDCISFIVMGDLGMTDALTADHHFEQAGFTALLT